MHTAPPRPEPPDPTTPADPPDSPTASAAPKDPEPPAPAPDSKAPTHPETPATSPGADAPTGSEGPETVDASSDSQVLAGSETVDASSGAQALAGAEMAAASSHSQASAALQTPDGSPRFSRALLALTAAATIAVAPLAASALGPADSGQSAHSVPVYLISRASHDIGHNDWAFQGQNAGRVDWVVSYAALGLFWLVIALWMRARVRRSAKSAIGAIPGTDSTVTTATKTAEIRSLRLWRRVLITAWSVEAVAGLLTLAAGAYAAWTSTPLGPSVLRFADLCSPWWSCVAAVLVVARAERSTTAFRAVLGYAALLTIVLLIPLPGPDSVKALLLALPAAIPALMTAGPAPRVAREVRPGAVAAG